MHQRYGDRMYGDLPGNYGDLPYAIGTAAYTAGQALYNTGRAITPNYLHQTARFIGDTAHGAYQVGRSAYLDNYPVAYDLENMAEGTPYWYQHARQLARNAYQRIPGNYARTMTSDLYRATKAIFTGTAAARYAIGTAKYAAKSYNDASERAARIHGLYTKPMYFKRPIKLYYKKGYVGPRTARLSRLLRRKKKNKRVRF